MRVHEAISISSLTVVCVITAAPRAQATSFQLGHTFQKPALLAGGSFGISVAAVGTNLLVGAENPTVVRLFNGAGGALLRTFETSSPAATPLCQVSVAAVGTNVLIGVPGDSTVGSDAGAAYLFDGTTGVLLMSFREPNVAAGNQFGCSVAAVGGNVLVGAPHIADPGAAYLFDGTTGTLLGAFSSPTPSGGDLFGYSVGAVGGNVLVGAPAGAAYLFEATTGRRLQILPEP